MGPWSKRFAVSTRAKIGLTFAVLALVLFGVVGAMSARTAGTQVAADAGEGLIQLATRMAGALDSDMFERYREVQNLAKLNSFSDVPIEPARWRRIVDQMQHSFSHYAWVGLADVNGKVLAATGGILEGADVAPRPWFQSALAGPFAGTVHYAKLLADKLPMRADGEPLRLVDVSAPLLESGRVVAVLGAHLDWAWAEERRRALLLQGEVGRGMELLIFDVGGEALLGVNKRFDLKPKRSLDQLLADRYSVETWSDGQRYLTAAVRCMGYREYPGLGWVVLARQPMDKAMAAADDLRLQIWSFGLVGAALFGLLGWWLAGWLTEPLRRVVARAMAASPSTAKAPDTGGPSLDEVAQLSGTLGDLVTQLRQREQDLLSLNQTLEQRVAARTATLEQVNADLRSFSHSVSHDLKAPIGSIGVGIRLAMQQAGDRLDPGASKILAVLVEECGRVRVLVDDLMALALVEQRALQHATVPMNDLVRLVVSDLRSQLGSGLSPGNAETKVTIDDLPDGFGDAVLLRQVWHNLLANAFKFSARSPQPHIRISAETSAREHVYVVSDNGAGFDAQHAERLFGLFQRLHRADDFPGTGIGLSIVKRVVHRHGGRVWAKSQPGLGASFFVALPVLAVDSAALLRGAPEAALALPLADG